MPGTYSNTSIICIAVFLYLLEPCYFFLNEILGLKEQENTKSNDVSDDIMQVIFSLRNNAKKNKDFATADFIRDELEKKGIQIKDSREGSSWSLEN